MPRINVSLIGGEHQFLHILPVAAALTRHDEVSITLFARSKADGAAAREMMNGLGAQQERYAIRVMGDSVLPRFWRRLVGAAGSKPAETLAFNRQLRDCDALLVSERTSALLTRLPGSQPLYIRFTHGVGDREKGFSKKARVFDHFIVAGKKYTDRFVSEGIAATQAISTSGYIKIPALRRLGKMPNRALFPPDRPTILYNAHFDNAVGSWPDAQQIIETILADGRFNLIVAPHMRLFANADRQEKERWTAYSEREHCIVDLGSTASTDMTYVDAADIYLGDVSSQVYEFLSEPRPCVFVNAHHRDWADDPSYTMWHLGDVVERPSALPQALEKAIEAHAQYLPAQREAIRYTLGDMDGDPSDRAAKIVLDLIARR